MRTSLRCATGMALVFCAISNIPSLFAEQAQARPAGFTALFNGQDLTGWEGDAKLWIVRDRMLVGKSPGIKYNDFLSTTQEFGDFELRLAFRLVGGVGNSGVQFRSKKIPKHVSGYQADIGEGYWGCLYDEARRNKVLVSAPPELAKVLTKSDWNQYVIRCEGDHIVQELNGLTTVDYREEDPAIPRSGIIALQIHGGGPMEIQFKDLWIKRLDKSAKK